jgi:hypothetical protein
MVGARVLPNIPADQYHTPFVYNATTHRVTLSPNSPLSPLPPTLQPR